jgi:hypothetical protein
LARGEAPEAKVVQNEKLSAGQPTKAHLEAPVSPSPAQLRKYSAHLVETDRISPAAGEMSKSLSHVGLAHPHRPEKKHGLMSLQEPQGSQIANDGHRQLGIVGEVEVFERCLFLKPGSAQAFRKSPLFPTSDLVFEEYLQKLQVPELTGAGLIQTDLQGV